MSKPIKLQTILVQENARLRFFSSSSSALTTQPRTTPPQHQNHQTTSLDATHLNPKFYIDSLLNCKTVPHIKQVHTLAIVTGMLQNLAVVNKLIYIYAHRKALGYAYSLFDTMSERDSVSWSAMVGGYAKAGDFINCFRTFRELIRSRVRPDNFTLPIVIAACKDALELKFGGVVQSAVWKNGLDSDRFVCAALVDFYARLGVTDDAKQLFDSMPVKDLVTWTVMISAYGERGNADDALNLFDQMRKEGLVPDKIAMVAVVHACAKLGALHKAIEVHNYIRESHISLNVILGSAIIDMYAKCGSVESAKEIFDGMKERNIFSWTSMIAAYAYHGQGRKALDLFRAMLCSGILPNKITFVSLLYACSHSGLVEEGLRIFSSMQDKYSIRPDVKHYTSMVDILGRAGRLKEALKIIDDMTVKKDEGLWAAFLGACRKHKKLDLAEKAAQSLLEMQPNNSGHYVLLSNIYANAGRWEDVAKIRDLMTQRRLKKVPGWTWIEVHNKIYRFGVADTTHPQCKEIHRFLETLYVRLELAGYVPDTDFVLHDIDDEVKEGMLSMHSEKLAIAFGLLATPEGTSIRITKNLRVCGDCHTFSKFVSAITGRGIIVRDANRFHHFNHGTCSCGDYW